MSEHQFPEGANVDRTDRPVRGCSPGIAVDPAELWEEWLAETDKKYRTPQSAMAFAVDRLRGVAQPTPGADTLKLVENIIYENASISHFGDDVEVDNAAFLARQILKHVPPASPPSPVAGEAVDKARAWDAVIAAREDERRECAGIAEKYDDCGGQFIAQRIRDRCSMPSTQRGAPDA